MSRAMLSAMMIGVFTMTAAVPDEGQAAQGAIAYSPGRAQVVFVTHDYGYTGPDRIPAGITTVEICQSRAGPPPCADRQASRREDG